MRFFLELKSSLSNLHFSFRLKPDVVAMTCAVTAYEKASQWQSAGVLLATWWCFKNNVATVGREFIVKQYLACGLLVKHVKSPFKWIDCLGVIEGTNAL